jgi:endonuclease VIII
MPEGPTLHRVARDLTEWIGGQKLAVSSPQGRFADEAKRIDGATLRRVEACGKHLFHEFSGDHVLHVHLGLYGKHRKYDNPPPEPRGAVRVRMVGKQHTVDLVGPNQCELIDADGMQEIVDRLGPDPLRDGADPAKAWAKISRSRTPVGQLLMDQSVVAGLGNIYRAELLWRHKIHPKSPGKALSEPQWKAIWKDSKTLMELAVKHGLILTAGKIPKGDRPTLKERFNIYKRPTCPRCGGDVVTFTQAGRTVYACDGCQPVLTAD